MSDEKYSKSLFNDDVRHNIDSVEYRWGREKMRRRKLMLKWSPLIVVVLIGCYLGIAKYCHIFPFSLEKYYAEMEAKRQEAMNKKAPENTAGYEEAKMRIKFVVEDLMLMSEDWTAVLNDLVDTKPSEVYYEVWTYEKLTDEDKKDFPMRGTGMYINGKTKFTVTDEKGVTKEVSTLTDNGVFDFDSISLTHVLNAAYMEIYSAKKAPLTIDKYVKEQEEGEAIRRKNALPEVVIPEESNTAKDEPPAKIDTTGGDPIVLPKFDMKIKNN